jgi:cobalamin biosynthesis protein CobW
MLVQGVRTRVVVTETVDRSKQNPSELVFIGYHLGRSRVAALLRQLTGAAWS